MLRLTGIAILIGSAAIMAAPVPKQDPLQARIQKLFGEFQDPDHCAECSMNAENQLSLTLRDGASQLWADEDDKKKGIAKSPLTRMIAKGDFDATVNVRMNGFPKPDKNDFYSFNVGMYISSDPKHYATLNLIRIDQDIPNGEYSLSMFSICDGKQDNRLGSKGHNIETTASYTLMLKRRGDHVCGALDRNGALQFGGGNDKRSRVAMNEIVSVGFYASSNIKGFTATFDSFKITPVNEAKP